MSQSLYVLGLEKGKLYDFFSVLHLSTKFEKLENAYGLVVNKNISDSYSRIKMHVDEHISGINLFCNKRNQGHSFLSQILLERLMTAVSIDDLIKEFQSFSPQVLSAKMLSYYDYGNEFSEHFYQLIIQDKEMLTEFMNGLGLSADTKWDMINFFASPQPIISNLVSLFEFIKQEINNTYKLNSIMIEEYYQQVKYVFEKEADNFLIDEQNYISIISSKKYSIIEFSVIFYTPYEIQYMAYNNQLNVFLGYYYEKSPCFNKNAKVDDANLFKSFTDNTRLKILELLKSKELCAGEIGRALNVPPSSLSHHLEVLTNTNIIKRTNCGKNSFFALQKDVVISAIKVLSKISS